MFLFFIINVLAIAWPVAILEIIIEKDKGWGAGHPKNTWYGKIIGRNNPICTTICKFLNVPYIFGYGLVMYGIFIPAILIVEYFVLTNNVFLLLAIFVAICFIEDFSWFLFNWNFDSLTQLFKGPHGNIWWHLKWVKIYKNIYIPQSYIGGIILTIVFLLLASYS